VKIVPATRFLILILGVLAALNSGAQEFEERDVPAVPEPSSLEANWWTYFEGTREEVEPRVAVFLDTINTQITDLAPQNQEIAESVLGAVRNNLSAYLNLIDEAEPTLLELPPGAVRYSLEDLLQLAAAARDASAAAAEEELEVSREERVLDGASRRRDAVFKDYVDADSGDDRWLAALRLVQARSAQAVSQRRLELLQERYERGVAFADDTAARVVYATERLEVSKDEGVLEDLAERVDANAAAVESAQERVRAAQLAASGLDFETRQGRSQQRLEEQRLRDAKIGLALAEVALAQAEAELWWTELALEGADTSVLRDQALVWSDLMRGVEQQAPDLERETEDELLAAQGANRDTLDRDSLRLLDQRVGTAQKTLADAGRLKAAVADLELLMTVVDNATAEYEGAFRSWLGSINRGVKAAYRRVASLGDVTLFSIGEAPVTGGDILRVIIILLVAMLLSRGIRHAIKRVGSDESSGTQASLYTVGRLTHYAIIILGMFIALSSIGLDFGSLALVAGALSVGIGFGLQSIVNNFVSGLIILFEHSLRVGDYIELDTGLTGTVKAINVRSTLINTNDNIDIVVPNSEFVSTRLTNWTLGERILRVRIPFGVAYGSDKELVKQAALEAAEEVPFTLANRKGREADVWLVEYGDNSLNFLLLVWVNRQGARRPTRTRSAYLWALETKLAEHGIEIPFPQRDLHLRSGWPDAD
jgi:small-conductance mechanosensitive channel